MSDQFFLECKSKNAYTYLHLIKATECNSLIFELGMQHVLYRIGLLIKPLVE